MNTVVRYRSSDFIHKILMPKEKNQWEVDQWCKEQFGPRWEATGNRSGRWCCFWRGFGHERAGTKDYVILDEKKFTMFLLRWA